MGPLLFIQYFLLVSKNTLLGLMLKMNTELSFFKSRFKLAQKNATQQLAMAFLQLILNKIE